MSGLEVVLLALAVAAAAAGVVVSLRARRLDRLHQTVVKSRRALELALRARAQYARDFAGSGTLDVAGGILLTDAAEACLSKGMLPIVDDGLDGIDLEFASRGVADDRRSIESSLSRPLRLTVGELESDGGGDFSEPCGVGDDEEAGRWHIDLYEAVPKFPGDRRSVVCGHRVDGAERCASREDATAAVDLESVRVLLDGEGLAGSVSESC